MLFSYCVLAGSVVKIVLKKERWWGKGGRARETRKPGSPKWSSTTPREVDEGGWGRTDLGREWGGTGGTGDEEMKKASESGDAIVVRVGTMSEMRGD